jgi:hypothetical protein
MPLFQKIISYIPKIYDIPPIPSILPKPAENISIPKPLHVPPVNSPLCSNCKRPISKESSEIKCEFGHVCCSSCFQTAVGMAMRFKTTNVPCAVTGCENSYSEETVDNNVSSKIGKQLSFFTQKETSQTPKVTSTSDSPKQLSTRTIHKKITYPNNSTHEGKLIIDIVFFFYFFKNYYLFFNKYIIYLLLII